MITCDFRQFQFFFEKKSGYFYQHKFSNFLEIAESEVESVAKYRESVEQQLESNREFHQRQVTRLRGEIDTKQKQIETLRDKNTEISTDADQVRVEVSQLKLVTKEKDEKLQNMSQRIERTDQAKNDLRGLEETGKNIENRFLILINYFFQLVVSFKLYTVYGACLFKTSVLAFDVHR